MLTKPPVPFGLLLVSSGSLVHLSKSVLVVITGLHTSAATGDRFSVMFCLARPGGGDQETSCQGLILVIIMVVTQDTDHCLL